MHSGPDSKSMGDGSQLFFRGRAEVARVLGLDPDETPFPVRKLLSELTLDYPRLQWESDVSFDHECWDAVIKAHELLVLHSYLDDRLVDGQYGFGKDAKLFIRDTLRSGIEAVAEIFDAAGVDLVVGALQRTYHSQTVSPSRVVRDSHDGLRYAEYPLPAHRASLGFVVTECISRSEKLPERRIRAARNAFRALVVGLQWADDLVDWKSDLVTGDENLLLLSLAHTGRNPYELAPGAARSANVAHALLEEGIVVLAANRAEKWFDIAIRKQEQLGARAMVEIIRRKRSQIAPTLERALEDAAVDVLERILPASSTA